MCMEFGNIIYNYYNSYFYYTSARDDIAAINTILKIVLQFKFAQ